jgi:hypothetical protein
VLIFVSLLINILPEVNLVASAALARANLDGEETVNERVRGINAEIIENIIDSFMFLSKKKVTNVKSVTGVLL